MTKTQSRFIRAFSLAAFFLAAAPLWSDALVFEDIFFNNSGVHDVACTSVSSDLSPVGCSAVYAPTGDFAQGRATFTRIDDSTFEFKGYIQMIPIPNSPVDIAIAYYLNLFPTVDAPGLYVVRNTGEIPTTFMVNNNIGHLQPQDTQQFYHPSGPLGISIGQQTYDGWPTGVFDVLVTETATPEPASCGLVGIAGLLLVAFGYTKRKRIATARL